MTMAKVIRLLQPATFAAVRCELSILLVVILFCSDDHFSAGMPFLQIPKSLGDVT